MENSICKKLNKISDTNICLKTNKTCTSNQTCFLQKVVSCCDNPSNAILDPGYCNMKTLECE